MPYLVIVSGAPASGKTTISRRLEKDLDVPVLAKDDIKEMLFDRLPQHDRDWSTIEGRMAISMMYAGAKQLLDAGYHIMIESSFNVEYSRPEIMQLVTDHSIGIIEVNCIVDHEVRQRRWSERAQTTRHPGHMDSATHQLSVRTEDEPLFPDLALVIDTGASPPLYEDRYQQICTAIQKTLGTGGRYETTN
jgi:predicted kinase